MSSLGILKPKNIYLLSYIGFHDPIMTQKFIDNIDTDFSLGDYKAVSSSSANDAFVFWSSEKMPTTGIPQINLFKLIYRILMSFDN